MTVNSGAWTFANDTMVALTGGVNGLNIDSNTFTIDVNGLNGASPGLIANFNKYGSYDWTISTASSGSRPTIERTLSLVAVPSGRRRTS